MDLIIYYDRFDPSNTNYYWRDNFEKFTTKLVTFELGSFPLPQITKLLREYKDKKVMLHLGGSAKLNMYAPIQTLKKLKQDFPNLRLTAHYGDVYYNSYNQERAKFFDAVHTTNASNLDKSLPSMYFFPHCVDLDWYDPSIKTKQYDIAFAGSPYSTQRVNYLSKIANQFTALNMVIMGDKWENHKSKFPPSTLFLGPTKFRDTIANYQKSSIVLDDPVVDYCKHTTITHSCALAQTKEYKRPICQNQECRLFSPTDKWFSSRPLHALLSRSPAILTPRGGQREVIPHAFYSKNLEETIEHIITILARPKEAQFNAEEGFRDVKKFTFTKAIEKLINHGS